MSAPKKKEVERGDKKGQKESCIQFPLQALWQTVWKEGKRLNQEALITEKASIMSLFLIADTVSYPERHNIVQWQTEIKNWPWYVQQTGSMIKPSTNPTNMLEINPWNKS